MVLKNPNFVVFKIIAFGGIGVKSTKWLYLSDFTSYQENKDTFISSTLKVEEIKVLLFSWSNQQIGYISVILPPIKKLRILLFRQL